MQLSRLVPVEQRFPSERIPDVESAVRREMARAGMGAGLRSGARIAIGVGSRGISNLTEIVRATVAHFRDLGLAPFLIPAMGSHGGGTAAGQVKVLAQYGVTAESAGCPIESQLETVHLGQTGDGIPIFMDRRAAESDGVFLVNRVKWHTTFEAPIESGLLKMAAIGLGKLAGADEYHRFIVRRGFGPVIESVGRAVVATGKLLGGLAIVEDAHHDTSAVEAIPAAAIPEREAEILLDIKKKMPRLGFDEIDILIVDEIGKTISGVGMDSKVINRHPYGTVNPWPWAPKVFRVYARTLSPLSYGNANGLGMADMVSDRLLHAIDWDSTKVNALTANNLPSIRTPLRAATDREALEILTTTVGRSRPQDVTFAWIRNTLELTRIAVTENLLPLARKDFPIVQAGDPVDWEFDAEGNLAGGLDRVRSAVA